MSRLLACCLVCVGFNFVCGENALNFVMLGDWGGQGKPPYYTKAEKAIAESMGKVAAQINSQFTVAMGDNFYPLGVTNAHDSRFQTTFEVGEVADVIPQSKVLLGCFCVVEIVAFHLTADP